MKLFTGDSDDTPTSFACRLIAIVGVLMLLCEHSAVLDFPAECPNILDEVLDQAADKLQGSDATTRFLKLRGGDWAYVVQRKDDTGALVLFYTREDLKQFWVDRAGPIQGEWVYDFCGRPTRPPKQAIYEVCGTCCALRPSETAPSKMVLHTVGPTGELDNGLPYPPSPGDYFWKHLRVCAIKRLATVIDRARLLMIGILASWICYATIWPFLRCILASARFPSHLFFKRLRSQLLKDIGPKAWLQPHLGSESEGGCSFQIGAVEYSWRARTAILRRNGRLLAVGVRRFRCYPTALDPTIWAFDVEIFGFSHYATLRPLRDGWVTQAITCQNIAEEG